MCVDAGKAGFGAGTTLITGAGVGNGAVFNSGICTGRNFSIFCGSGACCAGVVWVQPANPDSNITENIRNQFLFLLLNIFFPCFGCYLLGWGWH